MARQKRFFQYSIPSSVVSVVRSIISDYDRRERAIMHSAISGAVLDRYIELNAAVDCALAEIEAGIREEILHDIANGKGYERSEAQYLISKNAYYHRRRKLIYDIAVETNLIGRQDIE